MNKQSVYFEQYWDRMVWSEDISFTTAKEIFSSGWQQGIQETNEEILELLKALRSHMNSGIVWSNEDKLTLSLKVQVDCLISEMEKEK